MFLHKQKNQSVELAPEEEETVRVRVEKQGLGRAGGRTKKKDFCRAQDPSWVLKVEKELEDGLGGQALQTGCRNTRSQGQECKWQQMS